MKKIPSNPVKKRILEAIKPRGMQAKLALKLGYKTSSISEMLKSPGDPPLVYVQAVSSLTGKSIDWFLKGAEDHTNADEPEAAYTSSQTAEKLEQLIASQKRTIELLEEKVQRLEEQLRQRSRKGDG
jgi:hypothetical protein